ASAKTLLMAEHLADPSVAAGNVAIPVGAAPLRKFSGNIAFAARVGLEIWHHQGLTTDGQSLIENFTAWNITDVGIDLHYSGRIAIRNSKLLGFYEFANGYGVMNNTLVHDLTLINNYIAG